MSERLLGILLILCSTVIEALGQLLLKRSAVSQSRTVRKYSSLALGVSCFALEALVWSSVLRLLDVAVAYPMGSLTFVVVTLTSAWFLKERIAKERWLGVSLIICGTALLGIG